MASGITRALSIFLILSLLAVVFPACTKDSSDSGKIVLKVPSAENQESQPIKVMYKLFEEEHPDIDLKEVTVDLDAALAAGEAPDLYQMDPFGAREYYKRGYVEDISRYYEKYNWSKDMFDWARKTFEYDDKMIGIPWNYEGVMIMYNKTMFEKNGWTLPQNYNELMALAPKIKEKGIMPFAWGNADSEGVDSWWITSIINSVLGPDGTKQLFSGEMKWTEPEIVNAIQRYVDFWNEGYVTDKKSHAISQEDSLQLLLTEKAAMRLDGTWTLAEDFEADFELAYAPFPSWKPDGRPVIPLGVGGGFVINSKSEHKDEVAELLNYFFHPDVVKAMAENGVPAPVNADYSQMNIRPVVSSTLKIINDAIQNQTSGYVSWSYASPTVAQGFESDFAATYLKRVTVEEWLKNIQKMKDKDKSDGMLYELDNY